MRVRLADDAVAVHQMVTADEIGGEGIALQNAGVEIGHVADAEVAAAEGCQRAELSHHGRDKRLALLRRKNRRPRSVAIGKQEHGGGRADRRERQRRQQRAAAAGEHQGEIDPVVMRRAAFELDAGECVQGEP